MKGKILDALIGLTPYEKQLWELLEPTIEDCGLKMVRVKLVQKGRQTLEIMVDGADGKSVILDKCAEASRRMGRLLDVEDPLDGNYALEVSSPGIDRPLLTVEELRKNIDKQVKIVLNRPVNGGRKWKGIIKQVDENSIVITTTKEDLQLEIADMREVVRKMTKDEVAVMMKAANV